METFKSNRNSSIKVADESSFGYNLPRNIATEVHEKFQQWEIRRGFVTKEASALPVLRGIALRSANASKNRADSRKK